MFDGARSLLLGLENIVVIWLAANSVMNGSFTTGMLFSFSAYAQQFLSRAGNLVDALIEFRMLRLYVERLSDIALSHPESNFDTECEESLLEPVVELCNVSFRYSSGDPWILLNCSLRIEARSSVALVGPSGSGKTTVAKLILGLLEPTEGKICINGKDIRAIGLRTYRALAAAVMQEDQLFAGTINENISFFESLVLAERVEAAARAAGIHDDIVSMPMGYRSMVGDMGSALSGGQRQRVLLARALYRNPRILVLDEATSHFDVELEKRVNRSISQLNITRLIVAHRPETIASADHVVLLSNGTINIQR
jgi:ATP-binding cassette subfamily B protein RaxB